MQKNIWAFVNSHAVRSFCDDQFGPAAAACAAIAPVSMLCENTRVTQFTKVPILAETMATYCVKQGGVCLFLLHWINKQGGNPFVFEKTHAGQLSCCWATMGVGLQLTNCSQQGVKRSQFYLMFQSKMSYIFNQKHFYYCILKMCKNPKSWLKE